MCTIQENDYGQADQEEGEEPGSDGPEDGAQDPREQELLVSVVRAQIEGPVQELLTSVLYPTAEAIQQVSSDHLALGRL